MKRFTLVVALSCHLFGWNSVSRAQEAHSYSNLNVAEFTVSPLNGTAQPLSGVTGNGFAAGPSSNAINFYFGGSPLRSAGPLDAPQLCVGTPCSTIPEDSFAPTFGSNFVRADSRIASLDTFGAGTSFQLVAESQQTRNAALTGESFGVTSIAQGFSLSQQSQISISFLGNVLLEASLTPSTGVLAYALPNVYSEITIRQGTATAGNGEAVGPLVFSWNVNPTATNLQQGVQFGSVISAPFAIYNATSGQCGSLFQLTCGEVGFTEFDSGPGMFQAITDTLPSGNYTLTVLLEAHQQTAARPMKRRHCNADEQSEQDGDRCSGDGNGSELEHKSNQHAP